MGSDGGLHPHPQHNSLRLAFEREDEALIYCCVILTSVFFS